MGFIFPNFLESSIKLFKYQVLRLVINNQLVSNNQLVINN